MPDAVLILSGRADSRQQADVFVTGRLALSLYPDCFGEECTAPADSSSAVSPSSWSRIKARSLREP